MKKEKHIIKLPEGEFEAELLFIEEKDRSDLYSIYKLWRKLSGLLTPFSSRSINLPEALSEGAFSLEMGAPRIIGKISGASSSFDCYFLETQERIQVKASSVASDLTSFGPKSVWDKIYFCDFYREGKWDGSFDIYQINNKDIYNHKVNAKQTLKQQQDEGKRPRFSIMKKIIQHKNLKPVKTGNLNH